MSKLENITPNGLLKMKFVHNFIESQNSFYSLDIGNLFYLTYCFKKTKLSLHKKWIGHIIEFKNINTIEDIKKIIEII